MTADIERTQGRKDRNICDSSKNINENYSEEEEEEEEEPLSI